VLVRLSYEDSNVNAATPQYKFKAIPACRAFGFPLWLYKGCPVLAEGGIGNMRQFAE
jgi:hypothetical protein